MSHQWASLRFRGAVATIVGCLSTGFVGEATGQEQLWYWLGRKGLMAPDDQFGSSVSFIGDVDGDGVVDAVIGAVREDQKYAVEVGAIHLRSGATGTDLEHFYGPSNVDLYGFSVAGGGDFTGDGIEDFLVGAPYNSSFAGTVFVYSGSDGSFMYSVDGQTSGELFGFSISILDDVNQDKLNDYAVGAVFYGTSRRNQALGRVDVCSGKDGSILRSIVGTNAYDMLGSGVQRIGDIDGDGVDEFGVGASHTSNINPNPGAYSVFSGATGSAIYSFSGESIGDLFGTWASGLDDVDGDQIDDFVVAAPGHGATAPGEGRVYVYSGARGTPIYIFDGWAIGMNLGVLPQVGELDFNHDGASDIAVGTVFPGSSGTGGGFVYVYSGRSGRLLYTFEGVDYGGARQLFGSSLSAVGDMNLDGIDDLMIGAPGYNGSDTAAGQVYVYGGNDLFLQASQKTYLYGDTVELDTRGGPAYVLSLLSLTNVNGTPTFLPIFWSTLDSAGDSTLTGTVPPGLAGITVGFTAYALRASGKGIVDSLEETITFQ